MPECKRVIKALQIVTVSLAKKGTGRNQSAGIVLAKGAVEMSPEEMQAAMERLKTSLSEEDLAVVMALLEAAKAPVADAKADGEEETVADAKADGEEETVADAKADGEEEMAADAKADGEPEEIQKALSLVAKAEAERDVAIKELADRKEAERLASFVAKASNDMAAIPGIKAEEIGVILKSVHDQVGQEQADQIATVLTRASDAIARSVLTKAIGSGSQDSADPMDRLTREISAIRKANPELSREAALFKAARANPAVFKAAASQE